MRGRCIVSVYLCTPIEKTMRITLDLDEKLISQLMEVTSAKTKSDAIHQAAAELIRRKKLERLKALSGKLRISILTGKNRSRRNFARTPP